MSIRAARQFAIEAHAGQTYGRFPYEKHLQDVVDVLLRFGVRSEPVLEAAWLHDVLENTNVSHVALVLNFGHEVADIVEAVTDEPAANRHERHMKIYPKIRQCGANAVVVKLADRIANTEFSITQHSPILNMYRREFPELYTALYQPGECDAMWDHLRNISTGVTI